jgi:hypothetical protein
LIGGRLANWKDLQGVHAYLGIENFDFAKPAIHNIPDPIQRQASLGNICSDYALSQTLVVSVKNLGLQISRELTVNG